MTSPAAMLIGALLVAQQPTPQARTSHPETLDLMAWTAATYALNPDGTVAVEGNDRETARTLAFKSAGFAEKYGSAARYGLKEGDYPPLELCVGGEWSPDLMDVWYATPESRFKFDASLLLGEVAVTATVSDVIPGFSRYWPYSLLALTDVVLLHDASPTPGYVLVPVGRVVTHDRVFCGGDPTRSAGYDFSSGTRLAIVGSWHQGVVPVVTGAGDSGLLGVIDSDGSINWMMPLIEGAPADLPRLHQRVHDISVGGLLDLQALASRQKPFSRDRKMVRDLVAEHYLQGCRMIGYTRLGKTARVSRVCESGTPEEAARKLDRPAAELCDRAEARDGGSRKAWKKQPICGLFR